MGDVILFRQSRQKTRMREGERAPERGEILFFTGVRYQRMGEAPATTPRPTSDDGIGAKRKRKRG